MTDLEAMLVSIRENAADSTPRRIFADWLADAPAGTAAWWVGLESLRNDELAAWIRAQCDLHAEPEVKWKAGKLLGIQDRIDRRFDQWLDDMDREIAQNLGMPPNLLSSSSG